MSVGAPFPIVVPQDARRALGTEEFVRRVGKVANLGNGSKVLDLGAGGAALVLSREYGCRVTCADTDGAVLEGLRTRLNGSPGAERVEMRQLGAGPLPFGHGEYGGVVCVEKVMMPLDDALQTLRPLLGTDGHIALLYPVAVGRQVPTAEWTDAFGVPLLLPRDCLRAFERHGFESISVDTLSEPELDDYYDAIEESLRRFPEEADRAQLFRRQLEAHRASKNRLPISWACLVGRRKEPGEKPPPSRDSG